MLYTVGETAEKFNIAPSTLRYYDKEGLLPFVKRSTSGIRLFNQVDIDFLKIIECLKKTGMSIKEIKRFVDLCIEGDKTIEDRLDLIKKQQESVLNQIDELNEHLKTLNYKRWYYETAKEAGTCKVHNDIKIEDIPEEFRNMVKDCDK